MGVMTTNADAREAFARREKMLIGGEWLDAADGRTFDVETPAVRGHVIAKVPRGGAADVDRAVKAAAAAFPAWRATAPRDRGRLLWKVAPALIAGNTVVLKPSANAPLAVLALARIAQSHLPKGVLNLVTGTGDEVGTPF